MEPRTFQEFGSFLYRRRAVILITAASASLAALAVSLSLPKVYEATCDFIVTEPSEPPSFFGPDGANGAASREVLLPVITQERERSYQGLLESNAVWQRVHRQVPEKPFESLTRDVDVETTRKHIIQVRVRDADRGVAARTANAYFRALDDFLSETATQRQGQTSQNLATQLERTRGELAAAGAALADFLGSVKTADVPREVQQIIDRRASMEADLEQARVGLKKMESKIASAKDRQLVDRLAEYEVERASLEAEVAERSRAVEQLTAQTTALAPQQRKEEQLRADVARLQGMVDNLTRSLDESHAQARSREDQVVVVREAHPPLEPILPLPAVNALVAALAGIIGGAYLALFLEYLGRVAPVQERATLAVARRRDSTLTPVP